MFDSRIQTPVDRSGLSLPPLRERAVRVRTHCFSLFFDFFDLFFLFVKKFRLCSRNLRFVSLRQPYKGCTLWIVVPRFITKEMRFFWRRRTQTSAGSGCGLRSLRWNLGSLRRSTALSSLRSNLVLHELPTSTASKISMHVSLWSTVMHIVCNRWWCVCRQEGRA